MKKHFPRNILSNGLAEPRGLVFWARRFIKWMEVRNLSHVTLVNHHKNLARFINWCFDRDITRPPEVTREIMQEYQGYLFDYKKKSGENLNILTQCQRLGSVRVYFSWLLKNSRILYNPAAEIEYPKKGKTLPRNILTAPEVERIMNQVNVKTSVGIRDRAILETLYSTGARRMEIGNLCIGDIDREHATLYISGKGGKDRYVPIGQRALRWLDKYLQEARPAFVRDRSNDFLFLMRSGDRLNLNYMSGIVHKYIKSAGIGKQGSCHLFRHTAATLMLENGADIRYIQEMLGHVELETTQIYTRVSIRKLKRIHTLTHPSAISKRPAK